MAMDPVVTNYVANEFGRRRPAEPEWLARGAALKRFSELGFPTRREEGWRFTDLRPLQRTFFPPRTWHGDASPDALARLRLAGPSYRIVLVNGAFAPALSAIGDLPKGAIVSSSSSALANHPDFLDGSFGEDLRARAPFAALNAAVFTDGFVLALEDGVTLDRPVEVIHLADASEPASFHLRSAVLLGAHSEATLVESFAGTGEYWTNHVATLRLGEGASLRHVRIEDEGAEAIHFGLARASLGAKARYASYMLALGGRLARQDMQVRFDGAEGDCQLDGAYLLRDEQEATIATMIDHASPGCTTRELFKGVVDDRAHGVFLGTIVVRPDAQRSDAQQVNRNLLLSPRAAVDTKPELEILADDVKCAHGATVGDLDEEAMFYLRSRGIAANDARHLLIEAFVAETFERVADRDLRAHLAGHLSRWLGARHA